MPPFNINIMITIKKATKKQAEENAKKMSNFQQKMRQKKSEQQG